MKLYHITPGPLKVNSYFIVNEKTNLAILIDGGENYKTIKKVEKDYNFKITALLLTHAHFDHAGNAKNFQEDGVKIYISKIDAPKLLNEDNLSSDFGRKFNYCTADYLVSDGEELKINDINIKAILTPGHTDGSMTFLIDDMLFTGDTLFAQSIGRTDFKTGSHSQIIQSINKLFNLPGDYNVYPGHEEFTTLDYERKHNPFVDFHK